jgi:hypothetical protein
MAQKPTTFLLTGGLDLVTPRIAAKAGTSFAGVNFEPAERGYRRVGGYERFDGRLKPSEASYHYATFTSGSAAITLGTAITGGTSGATALAGAAATVTSGTTGGGNAAGYLPLVAVTGTFQDGEPLLVSAVDVATLTTAVLEGAPNDTLHTTYMQAEATRRRGLIQAVPGSATTTGVWTYLGEVYAFRNNAGGTATDMWKATTAGWTQVTFTETINFTTGTAEILEGDTLTKGGVTATVQRVILQSGTWAGTAAGYMVISGRSGGNYSAGAATSTSGAATLSGAQAAITLAVSAAGGKFRFVNYRFEGTVERMYGANGNGRAFEFDGTYLVPIRVPGLSAAQDKPRHINQFAEHLFLTYDTGAVVHSNLGNPREFSALEDAGEHNVGSTPSGLLNAQTSLVMLAKKSVSYMTGSDNDTFQLSVVTDDAGAYADSVAMAGSPTYVDDRGIRDLKVTASFGDWLMGSVSERVAPFFRAKHGTGTFPAAAIPVKSKNQYRVYYNDGTGMTAYLGRSAPELMPFELPIVPRMVTAGEDANGVEVIFATAINGYVYQMDAGPSFDGETVLAWTRLHFVSPGGTHAEYTWPWAEIELDGTSANTIYVTAEFDYGGESAVGATESNFTVVGGGEFWDAGTWDTFVWDAPVQGMGRSDIDGYGFNCGLAFLSDSIWEDPYTISSVRLYTSQRRQKR